MQYYKLAEKNGESFSYHENSCGFALSERCTVISKEEYEDGLKEMAREEEKRRANRTPYQAWYEDTWRKGDGNHVLDDGIYDVSNSTEFLSITDEFPYNKETWGHWDKVKVFMDKYPNYCVGAAYQCYQIFFLSDKPIKFAGQHTGSGFNHGSCNLLENCPTKLLILGEDD